MASGYLKVSRHGTMYYFRRRVPDDLRPIIGKPYLVKSLLTGQRREAIIRARSLAAQTDCYFIALRNMPPRKKNSEGLPVDFVLSWEPHPAVGKRAIAHDVKPDEEVSAAVAVATLQAHLYGAPMPEPMATARP